MRSRTRSDNSTSTRIAGAPLVRRLVGAVVALSLGALACDVEDRDPSVLELAEDADEPVAAGELASPPQKGAPRPARRERASFASFAVDLPASLPAVPAEVTLFKVVRGAPLADVGAMQRVFAVDGAARSSDEFGGMAHVQAGQRHLYVFDSGGAAFHDAERIGAISEFAPRGVDELRRDASRRLAALGLDAGVARLVPGPVTVSHAADSLRPGAAVVERPVAQSVSFEQRIDGLPTFGAGNDVQFVYADRGEPISFISHVRPLVAAGSLAIDSPEDAVGRYLARADRTGRWNLAKAFVRDVERIVIDRVQLGYFVPNLSVPCDTVEPVYAIDGVAVGRDAAGEPVTVPIVWLEPAAPGRALAELNVSSEE